MKLKAHLRPDCTFETLLFGLLLAAVARQASWGIRGSWPWLPAMIVGGLAAALALRHLPEYRTPRWHFLFWIAAAFVLLLRLPFPDTTFDVINYHLINGEWAVSGPPLIDGDVPYLMIGNPLADMILAAGRHLLGYRLGTAVNLLFLIWTLRAVDRVLARLAVRTSWRCWPPLPPSARQAC